MRCCFRPRSWSWPTLRWPPTALVSTLESSACPMDWSPSVALSWCRSNRGWRPRGRPGRCRLEPCSNHLLRCQVYAAGGQRDRLGGICYRIDGCAGGYRLGLRLTTERDCLRQAVGAVERVLALPAALPPARIKRPGSVRAGEMWHVL